MIFAFDLETMLIAPALQAPPVVAIGFKVDDHRPEIVSAKDPAFARLIETALADAKDQGGGFAPWIWTAHNGAFDFACLMAHNPEWIGPIFDLFRNDRATCTRVREKLIRIARADGRELFDLKSCCEAYELGLPLDKEDPWRMKYGELDGVPVDQWPEEARHYLHLDAIAASALYTAQEKYAALLGDQFRQARAALWLRLLECQGLRTDQEQVERFHKATVDGLQADLELITREGLIGAGVQTRARARMTTAYAAQGRTPPQTKPSKTYPQGQIALNYEACEGSLDPVLIAYTNFGQADKLRGKAEKLRWPVIQSSFDPLKATGRTSCKEGDEKPKPGVAPSAHGSQLQNPPQEKGIRECYVARAGHCFVSVDFDSFEMRTWAQVCLWMLRYSRLAEVLNDPKRCPHVEMGAVLRGMSVEAAYALKGDPRKELRGVAKGPNFGLPGGMGAARLIDYCRQNYGVILDMAQAQAAVAAWKQAWPEAQPYLNMISALTGPRGGKATITQFLSGRVRAGVGFCDAANGFFQGLAADAAKAAGWSLATECYVNTASPLYGCRIVNFVHDEFILEVPLERLHEAGHHARDVMLAAAQPWVPDVRLSASPAAMLRWSKSAGDPVIGKSGQLIPFECAAGYDGILPAAWHRDWWERNKEVA